MDAEDGYWGRIARGRITRRRLLLAGGAGATLVAGTALGCGHSTKATNSGTSKPAAGPAEQPRPGGVYNTYSIQNPPSLDPQRTTAAPTHQTVGGVYSRLFRFKTAADPTVAESKEPENDLALSAESPDAITWTIKLRPNATFQDIPPVNGHAVEAEDIKASFLRAIDPKNPNGGSLDMIDGNGITTPSSDTVVFKLNYSFASLPSMLAVPLYGWILPREATAGVYDPNKQVIGSGPFILDSITPDVAVVYKRNPNWFEQGRPYIDGVRVAIIPDANQQLAQFRAGNLDQVAPSAASVDAAQHDNPKATLYTGSASAISPLVGQIGDPTSPWADQRVRTAMSKVIDRAAIGASVMGGKFQAQTLLPLALGKWGLKPNDLDSRTASVYQYDVAAAKQMLSAAGAANLSFKFVYTPNGYPQPYGALGEALSGMLNAAGIKSNLAAVDYNTEYIAGGKGYRAGNFPKDTLVLGAISGGYTVIDEIMFAYYDSKSGKRFNQLNDPAVDRMVESARSMLNEADRLKAYQDLQKYLINKSYYITGLPWSPAWTLIQPRIRNYSHATSYASFTESLAKLWIAPA
jgi:peptide/nickel transport system substrate-binding protein